ncbi:MAG TPA: hypothetical protein VMK12_25855 [Anaeromyxobacteraceae bacterium]|nr:hypothetical protein [Anaeromyxobacteraceae bacterium]
MSRISALLEDLRRSSEVVERASRRHAALIHGIRMELDDAELEPDLDRVERALSGRLVADRLLLERFEVIVRRMERGFRGVAV